MTREQQQRTKIKICGLKRPEDITYVNEAKPDYCGFIIGFPKSSRNVTGVQLRELTARLASDIIPVGVFVNAAPERVEDSCQDYKALHTGSSLYCLPDRYRKSGRSI